MARSADGQIVYEVGLEIDAERGPDLDRWLAVHVKEMLALPGFVAARIVIPDAEPGTDDSVARRTVFYTLENRSALADYVAGPAERMRAAGNERFGDRLRTRRRTLATTLRDDRSPRCLNCRNVLAGQYCGVCGQRATTRLISLWQLLREALGDVLDLDSRLWRTLSALVLRPGFLTTEYLGGRRAHYMPPFRMYLVLSVVFFLIAFFDPTFGFRDDAAPTPADTTSVAVHGDGGQSGADAEREDDAERDDAFDLSAEEDIDCDTLGQDLDPALQRYLPQMRVGDLCRRIRADRGKAFLDELLDRLPAVMVFSLPLLALVLKLLYPLSRRYYVEHLLFIVHFHAFGFLILSVPGVLDAIAAGVPALGSLAGGLDFGITLYLPAYLYLSMRRVYAQGRALTLAKYLVLAIGYLFSALIVFLAAAVLSILSV